MLILWRRIAKSSECRANLKIGREILNVVADQNQVTMKVINAHFIVGLIGHPVLFGHAIGRDHHAGAVVSEITMHEGLTFRVVTNKLKERGDLVVGRAEKAVCGHANVFDSQFFDGALLGSLLFGAAAKINHHGNTEVLQLAVAGCVRLSAAIEEFADFAGIRDARQIELFRNSGN